MEKGQSELTDKIRATIKKKLIEINAFVDDELPDYIMILVANKRSKAHMEKDLTLFLGKDTAEFTNWLWQLVNNLKVSSKTKQNGKESKSDDEVVKKENSDEDADVLDYDVAENECDLEQDESSLDSRPLLAERTEVLKASVQPSASTESPLTKNVESKKASPKAKVYPVQAVARVLPSSTLKPTSQKVYREDEYDPMKPEFSGSVSSVVRVSQRNQPRPALKANKLLLRAVDDATKSVLDGKSISDYYKPTPINVLSLNKKEPDNASGLINPINRQIDARLDLNPINRQIDARLDLNPINRQIDTGLDLNPINRQINARLDMNPINRQINTRLDINPINRQINARLDLNPINRQIDTRLDLNPINRHINARLDMNPINRQINTRLDMNPVNRQINARLDLNSGVNIEYLEPSHFNEGSNDSNVNILESERYIVSQPSHTNRTICLPTFNTDLNMDEQSSTYVEERPKSPHFIVTLDGVDFSSLKRKYSDCSDDESMEVDEEIFPTNTVDEDTLVKKQKIAERCKYWPACKNSDNCVYHHPTVTCKSFPDCKYGDKCLYIHPNCKFDSLCTRKDCPFTHASKRTFQPQPVPVKLRKPKIVCKFYPKCTAKSCPFVHPKLCRYGAKCRLPVCPFSHFNIPSRSQLKWKADASLNL